MGDVFISYRREDSAGYAGRLCDRLSGELGADRVFMDVQDIQPGQRFTEALEQRIGSCAVVLAIIGPRWLSTIHKRMEEREDFVRNEIAAALSRRVPIIPVLVGGAAMPNSREVPAELAGLTEFQALTISDDSFDQDAGRLTAAVRERAGGNGAPSFRALRKARLIWAAIALVGLVGLLLSIRGLGRGVERVDGTWSAMMEGPGQRPYRVQLHLSQTNGGLFGTVDYPTGTGSIQNGKISDRRISFETRHVPQFGSEPATILFSGELRNGEMRLTLSSESGVATGVARRVDGSRTGQN